MTPVSVFFSAQIPIADFQRPLCQQLQSVQKSGGFGEAPQQAFLRPSRAAKIASVATLALLAVSTQLETLCFPGISVLVCYVVDRHF